MLLQGESINGIPIDPLIDGRTTTDPTIVDKFEIITERTLVYRKIGLQTLGIVIG